MSNIAVIPKFEISADLASQFQSFLGADDLDAGVSGGYPVMSIRGAKWRIVEGGEESPIYMPGTKDLAPAIKVVLMRANQALSKTFYLGKYVEGSDTPPDCSSNDGIRPLDDSPNKQSDACATCPQNVWGSKINESSGKQVKACADVRRMAILPADDMSYSPILLRVPGASLGDLAAYGKALKKRGIPYAAVVTKLAFDADAAYPKITFQFERVLTAEEMALVAGRMDEPIIDDIIGLTTRVSALPAPAADQTDKFGIPADIKAPPAAKDDELEAAVDKVEQAAAPTSRPKARAKPGAGFNAAAETPPATKPEPAAATTTTGGDMLGDIEDALASLNF